MAIAVLASCLGWSLDLFDLFILLYVADVIGKLFFPSEFPTLSLAAVYASFAVTLLMRPFGSALFGSYADRHGRRGAMIAAITGVGIATAAFGALPTIDQAGLIAPVLFVVLRLVQGVFVGGVVAATHTIGTESVPPSWRGAMSGLVGGGGAGIGALIASAVYFTSLELFPGDLYAVWGWRFMFFSGILSAALGLFIFTRLEESPVWMAMKTKRAGAPQRAPLRALFSRDHRGTLAVNLLLTAGAGGGYYLTSGYMPTVLKLVSGFPPASASAVLMLASALVVFASVGTGHASTIWGRRRALLVLAVGRLVLLPLLYLGLAWVGPRAAQASFAVLLILIGNAGYGPLLIFLNERFPTALRSTGTALSWNLGFAVGGMLPAFVSLSAGSVARLPQTLAFYLFGISLLFLAGALIVPETRRDLT